MNAGIGPGKTREDHKSVSDQLYAAYAQGKELRGLVAIVGEDALNERDLQLQLLAEQRRGQINRRGDFGPSLEPIVKHRHEVSCKTDQKWIDKYHPGEKSQVSI